MPKRSLHGLKMFFALSLASIVALSGCGGGNTPAGAYRDFLAAFQKGDIDGAAKFVSLTTTAKTGAVGMDPKFLIVNTAYQATKAKGGIKSYTVDDDGVQGTTAYVKFVITFGDGTSDKGRQQLQKSADGKWQWSLTW